MGQDISVKIGKYLFNYRVAAIVRRTNAFLVCRSEHDNFCYLPGGRVQDGESALAAIKRELREELQIEATIKRAVFFVEDFYSLHGGRTHELCLYYEVALPDLEVLLQVADDDDELLWLDVAALRKAKLKPDFLVARLETLPQTLEHLVFDGVLYDS